MGLDKTDSARIYVDQAYEIAKLSKDEKWMAKCFLAFASASYFHGDYLEAVSQYQFALDYFRHSNQKEGIYKALFGIGISYSKIGHYQKASEFLIASLRQAEELENYQQMATTYNSLGVMAKEQKNYKEAIRCYQKTIELYKKSGTVNAYAAGAYTNLANVYMLEEQVDSAIVLNRYALHLFDSLNSDRGRIICYSNLGACYLKKEMVDLALEFSQKAYSLCQQNEGFHFSEINALLGLGELHIVLKKYAEAENYLLKAVQEIGANEKSRLIKAHTALASCYTKMGRYEAANQSLLTVIELKDSVYSQEMSEAVAHSKAIYESEKQEKQIQLLEKDKEINQMMIWTGLGGFFLIMTTIAILFSKHRERVKKDNLIFKEKEEVSRLREEQMTQQLDFKNKMITTHSLNIIQKNEMLDSIREQVLEIAKTTNKESQTKILKLARLIDRSSKIEEDWEEFKLYFEQVHTSFFEQLKRSFPDLTPNDLKLCALIKLNLNIKQMSNLMNISTESVKMARYRLRKKLNMATEENLTEYFTKF